MEKNDILIKNKYVLESFIGNGKFGKVYKGFHKKTREPVAIKIEKPGKLLQNETTILNYLYNAGSRNIPTVYWYGLFGENVCLIMTYYKISLFDYIQGKELTPSKILSIFVQSISILENIHQKFVIHRDIKPQNIMMKDGELSLIDFGFSTFYVDDEHNHLPLKTNGQHIIGTPRYVSVHIHDGIEYSRRDDLISLGYMFLFIFYRELPWDITENRENKENYEETHVLYPKNQDRKIAKLLENIECFYSTYNTAIFEYLKYCYSLPYDETPRYDYLKDLFLSK